MDFQDFDPERRFREAWDAVDIARPVHYSLFTFGESVLPYYLVCAVEKVRHSVSITQGEVRVQRPMIVTADNARPEFRGFFENQDDEGVVQFLLARTARFSNLTFDNQSGRKRVVKDPMDVAVERLNRQLDDEEEDRVAILTAPPGLGGVAILRYATERVWKSSSDNIQELRERGYLP